MNPTSTATNPAAAAEKLISLRKERMRGRILSPGTDVRAAPRGWPRAARGCPVLSDLDLGAQLHHGIAGQVEEACGAARVVVHLCEEFLPPGCHAAADRRGDHVPGEEVAGGHRLQFAPAPAHECQCARKVGVILEAIVHHDLPAVAAERLDLQALVETDPGDFMVADGDEQVLLVQDLVVLEVVEQRVRHRARLRRQEDGRAIHARGRADEYGREEVPQVDGVGAQLFVQQLAAALPRHHEHEDDGADHQREPAALQQLEQVGAEEGQVHEEEEARGPDAQRQRVPPAIADDEECEHGGDEHVQRDGNAVGGREVAAGAEHDHGQDDGEEQCPIDERYVDLSGIPYAGVQDVQPRQVAQLDHLLGHAERSGDQGLGGDDGGHGGHDHERDEGPVGGHHVERVLDGFRLGEQEGALPEIVDGEGRHRHAEPCQADRLLSEVPEIGIEGFGPGHAEDHRAQDDEARSRIAPDEAERVVRAQGSQDFRVPHDVRHAEGRDGGEPHERHRTEIAPDATGAALLHGEQAEQHDEREGDDGPPEVRRHDLQPFHRRKHGYGGRDDSVAIEQGGSEHSDAQQRRTQLRFVLHGLGSQGQHGDEPALAIVVRPQHEHDVLQRDDGGERPEKDGQDAIDVLGREGHVAGAEDFLDGIQHAGADVAIHDADGAEGERRKRGFGALHCRAPPAPCRMGFRYWGTAIVTRSGESTPAGRSMLQGSN